MSLKFKPLARLATGLHRISSSRSYHNLKIASFPRKPNLTFPVIPTCAKSLFRISKRFNQHKKTVKCWQCGIERKNVVELFCEKCHIIQNPPDKHNYFKVLDVEEKFDLDSKQLTEKYRKMQSVLHPDKFSNKSDQEKVISEEFSSLVNKAYDTLQSPLKRAVHLLTLRGGTLAENQTIEDPEFLMTIMELNEEVESANTPEKLISLNKKNKQELETIATDIKKSFDSNNLAEAKKQIIKMKYYTSVSNHINGLMRDKGIIE